MSSSEPLLSVISMHSGIPLPELERVLAVLSGAAPTLAAREQEIRTSLVDHRDFSPEEAEARIKHLATIGVEGLTDVKRKETEFAQLHQPLREIRRAVIAAAMSVGSDAAPPSIPAISFTGPTASPAAKTAVAPTAAISTPDHVTSGGGGAAGKASTPAVVTPVKAAIPAPAPAPVVEAPAPSPAPVTTVPLTTAIAAAEAALLKIDRNWAAHSGAIECLLLIPAARMPAAIRELHPCPLFLASGGEDKEVKVWRMDTSELVVRLSGHTKTVRCMAQLHDGRLATACNDGIIRIFNLARPTEVVNLSGHAGFVTCLLVTTSGILASAGEDRTIRFWDVDAGCALSTFSGHSHVILCMALLGDGSRLVSGDCDGRIKIWDVADGTCLQTLSSHSGWVTALLPLPDGRFVSASCDKTLRVWTLDDGAVQSVELRGHTQQIYGLALLSDFTVASGGYDKRVRVWDVYAMKCNQVIEYGGIGQYAIAALPGGGFVSAGGSAASPSVLGPKPAVPVGGPSYPITVVTRS